ncbi:unnamed protein product, partial [Bubo scandiacus]
MPTVTLWLPLVWLVATVTPVPTPEASPSRLKLLRQHPMLPVPPHPIPGPPGDVGAPILPVPTPCAHPEELPGSDAPLKPTDPPSPEVLEGAPQELGATSNSSTAGPTPSTAETPPSTTEGPLSTTWGPLSTTERPLSTTEGPPSTPGTSAPPCPGDEEQSEACGAPTEEQRAAVAEALGTFALRFYQHMAEAAQPDANLLFSPINVVMGLSHLLLGARGETRERLAAVLAHPPGLACPHTALRQLAGAPGLFSAAQIFHHPGLSLRPRFLNESWHFYGARPRALSGNESLDLLRVNAWVREASQGLLPALLPALPSQPHLLLLSAVHLQATWRTPLKAKQTVPLPFLRPGHPPRLVPTMTSKKYPVASFIDHRLQVQVGRLELSGGLSLVVLVPQGAPGGTGGPGAGAGPPHLPGAAAEGGPHPPPGHCPGPAPPAPRPRPGCGSPGPRHGLRAVPGRGAVRAGAGPSGGSGHGAAPGGAGAGRGRCGGGGCHGHLGGPHGPAAGGPAPLPLRPLARRRHRPPLHGPPQRPPAL